MLKYTPRFDAFVAQLRKRLGGEEWVRVDDGHVTKVAVIRTKRAEIVIGSVRMKGYKERLSRHSLPDTRELRPFKKPIVK